MEHRAELRLAAHVLPAPQLLGDADGQCDDVLGVAARVLVLLLEQVAEEQGRPAIGLAELERPGDAGLALAREHAEQADEREHQQRRAGTRGGRERREQPDGRQERVHAVHEDELAERLARRHAVRQARPADGDERVEQDLRREGQHVDGPVAPFGLLGARQDEDERGAERVPGVRGGEHPAAQGDRAAGGPHGGAQHTPCRDEQRDEGRRQEQQHRHEHELRRRPVARAHRELDARGDGVGHDEGQREHRVEVARRRGERGERDGGEHEGAEEQPVAQALAMVGRARLAVERLAEAALCPCVEVRGVGSGHGLRLRQAPRFDHI
ncbi:MAG: hypothetical protein AVDCRST_MAG13-3998 [uncultured Solirubrobacteraceae bacterium]|uniref:Uncharacterized protein n=1 Tax=uncultured Solirubrobacteraceae bacterium TaxID=1162706 RepID=A0A6J4TPU0_9ACTN|nr:MAG: hypothetical protein AVDCRST_MAG13-3998 [uncultured Solirubrobacteraceae bacterium]